VFSDYMQVQGISHRFGEVVALNRVTFSVTDGELVSFVGPSGAGKTTLLRLIAGIDTPQHGSIDLRDGYDRRHPPILVFQDYVLFPHMSVFDNVAFGLRSRRRRDRLSRHEIETRVDEYLQHLGISAKRDAFPAELSGGQRQRVALARALVLEPSLLLLDEPFANLDRRLKGDTAFFIRDLQNRLGVTTITVSHDLDETMAISDRVGVLVDGALHQLAPPEVIRRHPASEEVSEMFRRNDRLARVPTHKEFVL
jgi:putative spermidine/putrescine transport system ATP-binding protein